MWVQKTEMVWKRTVPRLSRRSKRSLREKVLQYDGCRINMLVESGLYAMSMNQVGVATWK